MTDSRDYGCNIVSSAVKGDATARIGEQSLCVSVSGATTDIDYSTVASMRLISHRLYLETTKGRVVISMLGRDTEGFFEQLWTSYNARVKQALFVEQSPVLLAEGDYRCRDAGGDASGFAKLALFDDCVCVFPADDGGRRIPLCFITAARLEGYCIYIELDTSESYVLARLGRDTVPFFERIEKLGQTALQRWQAAGREVEAKACRCDGYSVFSELCPSVVAGLFRPDAELFWFAGAKNGKAAVELVTGEQSATYLYKFKEPDDVFIDRLRHAMEQIGAHREMITMEDGALEADPLYSMSAARSPHLRFLRSVYFGRVIHTDSWSKKLSEFFA